MDIYILAFFNFNYWILDKVNWDRISTILSQELGVDKTWTS